MPIGDLRITVSEIWHLALPPGTQLAAGSEGLGRTIEWAASLRAAFPVFGGLSKGYLALARLGLAQRLDASLTPGRLIQELWRVQASGLVVDEPLSAQDAALADEKALPVLVLPQGVDLHEVERDVLRMLVDREGQITRREIRAREQLQRLFDRGGMQAVLDELARITRGAVTVSGENDQLIAQATRDGALEEFPAVRFPVRVGERSLGELALHADPAHQNPMDAVYARQAAELCGIELLQQAARQETEERLGADLVEQLLDPTVETKVVAARLCRLGYDLSPDRKHVVAALAYAMSCAGYAAADARGRERVRYDVARDLQWAAQRDGAQAIMLRPSAHTRLQNPVHQPPLLVFFCYSSAVSDRQLRNWLREALSRPSGKRCRVGVSRVVADLAGLREAVRQASDALELGQCIEGHKSPFYYEELGLYRLLAGLRTSAEMVRFYEETLGALVRYDAAHGTELVATLGTFFEQNTNVSQTSRVLFVHRNTLAYRLQRIVEITGLDLNDAEARLAFQVALKIHRLRRHGDAESDGKLLARSS